MKRWDINGTTLEYDDDTHTYLVEGMIVPSVTQILKKRFGHKYDMVDAETLQRAANRGTQIHKAIEDYNTTGEDDGSREVHNFRFLMKLYGYRVFECETPIVIKKDEEPIAAGRLDLVLDAGDCTALADIKTTSSLDKEYLAYQLNLYRIGYMQTYDISIDKLFGIHLREDTRKLVNIPINERLAWELLEGRQDE